MAEPLPPVMQFPARALKGGTVAILGGTGFVGRALIDGWPVTDRHRLRVLIHRSRPDWLKVSDFDVRAVDAASVTELARAFDGATTLIDLLRPIGDGSRLAVAECVGKALAEAGVRRVIHASSIDVYGNNPAPIIDPETPATLISAYADEHLAAERLAEKRPLATTILRLGAVFGPGGRNLQAIANEVATAPAWRLAARRSLNGSRRLHLVSLETVVQTVIQLANADAPPPRLIVTDDAAPENNFATVQDLLIRTFRRPDVSGVPVLPRILLRAALALRGQPGALAHRRFSEPGLGLVGRAGAERFFERLGHYVGTFADGAQGDRLGHPAG